MDQDNRIKALSQLAKSNSEKANLTIQSEYAKLKSILNSSLNYEELEECLDTLKVILHKVAEDAVPSLADMIKRLEIAKLILPDSYKDYPELYNHTKVQQKALELLGQLRYWNKDVAEQVISLIIEFSMDKNEPLRNKAQEQLKLIAEIDLKIFKEIGLYAQRILLDKIISSKANILANHVEIIWMIAQYLFATDIDTHHWKSDSIAIEFGGIPASDDLQVIRQELLDLLLDAYPLKSESSWKMGMIDALNLARREYSRTSVPDSTREIIKANSIQVLTFFKSLVETESLAIISKLEHDIYWAYYHANHEEIKALTLEIRDLIFSNNEYVIFRKLVGHEVLEQDWENSRENRQRRDHKEEEAEAITFAKNISEADFDEWCHRILNYADQIDYAGCAPYKFDLFITELTECHTEKMMEFLEQNEESLSNHIVAFLIGFKAINEKFIQHFIDLWLSKGEYIRAFVRMFNFSGLSFALMDQINNKAIELDDEPSLIEIMSGACRTYNENEGVYFNRYFETILDIFIEQQKSQWINQVWFMRSNNHIIKSASDTLLDKLLTGLLNVDVIDYQSETILLPISQKHPSKVINYFGDRIKLESVKKKENRKSKYEAIPYNFNELSKSLVNHPNELVDAIYDWWKEDQERSLFQYRGAKVISNSFKTIEGDLENRLLEKLFSGEDEDMFFVLSILENYDGNKCIHNLCREIVAKTESEKVLSEVRTAIWSTGVVRGEYGYAEALEARADLMADWQSHSDDSVKSFAAEYESNLRADALANRKRADEEIILRKHQYGEL